MGLWAGHTLKRRRASREITRSRHAMLRAVIRWSSSAGRTRRERPRPRPRKHNAKVNKRHIFLGRQNEGFGISDIPTPRVDHGRYTRID